MTKQERDKLRDLALAATPGEWDQKNTTDVFGPLAGDSGDGTMADSSDAWMIADCSVGLTSVNGELATMDVKIQRRNAAYIAAANPATLLALLDRIDELDGGAEPALWSLSWAKDRGAVNHFTCFRTEDDAQKYADGCLNGDTIEVVPLYRRPPTERAVPVEMNLGMTLRDYFACQALKSYMVNTSYVGGHAAIDADIARYAYELAEAMLEARNTAAPGAGGGE